MARAVRLLCLIAALVALPAVAAQIAMSPCLFGRATSGYTAPIPSPGVVGGTCGFGPAQAWMPPWFASRYVSAPDDETYNGYPWLSPPVYISTTGIGKACGECFELTGNKGTIRVMNVDVCNKGCPSCTNCWGSQSGDLPDFDVDMAVFGQLTTGSGHVPIAYRKVSCDMPGLTVGVTLSSTLPSFFRMTPYAYVVGVQSIEVRPNGGSWTPLVRAWQNWFEWSGRGDILFPFDVRITSILNETITLATSVNSPIPSRLDFGKQFTAPAVGYGGGNQAARCMYPGPDPQIWVSGFGGPPLLQWRDWGSYTTTDPVYTQTTGCYSSPCIRIPPTAAFTAMQIGHDVGAPYTYWTNVTWWARSDTPIKIRTYYTGGNSGVSFTTNAAWTFYTYANSLFTADVSQTMAVLQFQVQSGGSTSDLYIDDIQWVGSNFTRTFPVIGGLSGPPIVGFPGYAGIDPATGQPTVGVTAATSAATVAATTSTASTTRSVTTSQSATTLAVTSTTAVTSTALAAGGVTGTSTAAASTTAQVVASATASTSAAAAAASTSAVTSTAFAAGGVTGTTTAASSTTAAIAAGAQQATGSTGGGGGGPSGGVIAGIVIGVLLGVALIAVIAFFAYRHFAKGGSTSASASAASSSASNEKPKSNPSRSAYNISI